VYQNAEGYITHANPAAERMLGLSLAQMQGRTSMHPEWQAVKKDGSPFPGNEHPSMVALRTGKGQKNVVMGVHNPRKKGYTWLNINAVPQFRTGQDKPYEVYTTFEELPGAGPALPAGKPAKAGK
jgi:PAS domain-containing protein